MNEGHDFFEERVSVPSFQDKEDPSSDPFSIYDTIEKLKRARN